MENNDLVKSLTDLIDETLAELATIEDLRKSKTEAEETTIDGASANGGMKKKEDEDDGEDDEDEEEDKAEKADKDDDGDKDDKDDEDEDDEDDMEKAESRMKAAKEEMEKAEACYKAAQGKKGEMTKTDKSVDQEALAKSIDERVKPLEGKLNELTDLVRKIADQPVPAKGASYKDVTPLAKSIGNDEPLSKAVVLDRLFDLKKSGKNVEATDVFMAETGSLGDVSAIANKYGIK